jgi:hypothetical protein
MPVLGLVRHVADAHVGSVGLTLEYQRAAALGDGDVESDGAARGSRGSQRQLFGWRR